MKVVQLTNILRNLPVEYSDRPVYLVISGLDGVQVDPTLYTDATEVVVDVEDACICIKAVIS